MPNQHRLSRTARQHGRIHKAGLTALAEELPATFKMGEAMEIVDWDQGTFLKLKQAGLLENETPEAREAKDWALSQQAQRWIRTDRK